jgi:hypothetical protein
MCRWRGSEIYEVYTKCTRTTQTEKQNMLVFWFVANSTKSSASRNGAGGKWRGGEIMIWEHDTPKEVGMKWEGGKKKVEWRARAGAAI